MVAIAAQKPKPGSLGRACVYTRTSDPDSKKDASLDKQEQATIAHMQGLGYLVEADDVYREHCTGKDQVRPILIRLKAMMREGRYRAIGFYCLDRFVRSQVHTAILFDELDKLGVKPVSATNDIGDDTPEGKLILAIRAYLAESERLKIEDRMQGTKAFLRASGKFLKIGLTRFGYDYDKATRMRAAREDEAKTVRWVFEQSANGASFAKIALGLTTAGTPTPSMARGKRQKDKARWNDSLIRSMVRDPIYKGWTIMCRYRRITELDEITGKRTRRVEEAPEEEWIVLDREGAITEAIVSPDLWAEANRRAKGRFLNRGPSVSTRTTSENHLLRGMAFCAQCGSVLYGSSSTKYINKQMKESGDRPKKYFYLCRSRHGITRARTGQASCTNRVIPACQVDAAAWEAFRAVVITPQMIEDAVSRLDATVDTDGVEHELAAAQRVLDAQVKKRNALYEKWTKETNADNPDTDFADRLEADYRALRGPIEAHKEAVATLTARLEALRRAPSVAEDFQARFESLRRRLLDDDEIEFADRFAAMKLANVRVVVGDGHLDVYADLFGELDCKLVRTSSSSDQFATLPLLGSIRLFESLKQAIPA